MIIISNGKPLECENLFIDQDNPVKVGDTVHVLKCRLTGGVCDRQCLINVSKKEE